jgi:hypothetical protein
MSTTTQDPKAQLEAAMPEYERLRNARIRAEGDKERLESEYQRAREQCIETFGTDDLVEIEARIRKDDEENAEKVRIFDEKVRTTAKALDAVAKPGN